MRRTLRWLKVVSTHNCNRIKLLSGMAGPAVSFLLGAYNRRAVARVFLGYYIACSVCTVPPSKRMEWRWRDFLKDIGRCEIRGIGNANWAGTMTRSAPSAHAKKCIFAFDQHHHHHHPHPPPHQNLQSYQVESGLAEVSLPFLPSSKSPPRILDTSGLLWRGVWSRNCGGRGVNFRSIAWPCKPAEASCQIGRRSPA